MDSNKDEIRAINLKKWSIFIFILSFQRHLYSDLRAGLHFI